MAETPHASTSSARDGDRTPVDRLGRPLRDLRISVTDRCNFRCTYCMPAEIFGDRYQFLPRSEILSFEEIERLVRIFGELGALKLRVTGGEPLLRVDLPDLVGRLARVPGVEDLALTTNATLLPRQADALRAAGLRRVTISLDSLDEDVFRRMNGDKLSVDRVLDGIAAAEQAGLGPVKINCVVQKGVNDNTLVDLAKHFRGTGHIVRFIEYMDVGTRNQWDLSQVLSAREIIERIDAELPLEPVAPNYRGEVAKRWRYADGQGEIGVIASVTQPFCGECTRARLTTEGQLVTCLFASGGTDLRAPLRGGASDDELRDLIARVWRDRSDRYSEEREALLQTEDGEPARDRIEMYQVGG
jgi:cyclic pyranopterin phosphate synthase